MATIHFILQGKGGVGKSMIAVMLYQALRHFDKEVIAFDTVPVNSTFASFKELNVTPIDVMSDGNIDQRKFDALLEALVEVPQESHVIVDNGASSFVALSAYLSENDVIELLNENGHRIFFHSIITGGQGLGDTLKGLAKLCMVFPTSPIIVWLNSFFGSISIDGKEFSDFTISQEKEFHSVINIPTGNKATLGRDLEELFAKRKSFDAAINGSTTHIAVKSRLRRYWNQILSCIEQAQIL